MRNKNGNVLPIILGVLLIAFVVWIFFYVRDHRHDQGSTGATGTASNAAGQAQLSSGSSNDDLNSDLQTINSGLTQGDKDLQNSDNALNDQQLPVTD